MIWVKSHTKRCLYTLFVADLGPVWCIKTGNSQSTLHLLDYPLPTNLNMRSHIFSMFLLPLLALVRADQTLVSSQISCTTTLASTSATGKVPTVTESTTYYYTIPVTTSSYPTTTVTPRPLTLYTTSTSIYTSYTTTQTTDVVTQLVTSTETDSTTSTSTSTSVSTATVTAATAASTVTVSTVPGFTPVASGNRYIPRDLSHVAHLAKKKRSLLGSQAVIASSKYPKQVTCSKTVERYDLHPVTETASTKTVTAKAKSTTVTKVATTSVLDISTLADSTMYSTYTDWTTTTLVSTVLASTTTTTTISVPLSAATVYDACQANNLVASANGDEPIYEVFTRAQTDLALPDVDDQVSCCNACQSMSSTCSQFYFNPSDPTSAKCHLYTTTTCNPAAYAGYYYSLYAQTGDGIIVGNGPCNQWADAGSND